jgi:hypothetical protein
MPLGCVQDFWENGRGEAFLVGPRLDRLPWSGNGSNLIELILGMLRPYGTKYRTDPVRLRALVPANSPMIIARCLCAQRGACPWRPISTPTHAQLGVFPFRIIQSWVGLNSSAIATRRLIAGWLWSNTSTQRSGSASARFWSARRVIAVIKARVLRVLRSA